MLTNCPTLLPITAFATVDGGLPLGHWCQRPGIEPRFYHHELCQSLLLFSHSIVSDSATQWTAARQASLSFNISQNLLKLMSIESVVPSNHLILCFPLLLLPSIFPSIRVFSNESALRIRWPKYWSFSFSISPSNEYSGLVSCRIGCFDFLAVQGSLKSLLQHHNWKASICISWGNLIWA